MSTPQPISYAMIFFKFLKFGFLAWGGPVAQIGMLKQTFVDEQKLLTQEKFKRVLAVYQILPGPEAQELCVYFGTVLRNRISGFLAGLGFMLPGFGLMLVCVWLYMQYGTAVWFLALAYGIQPVVSSLMIRAIHRIGSHVLTSRYMWFIMGFAIVGTALHVHFAIVLAICGGLGILLKKSYHTIALILAGSILLVAMLIYLYTGNLYVGDLYVGTVPGSESVNPIKELPTSATVFLSGLKSGMLTFGGAYTVLAFLEHDGVQVYQWLSETQLADGIALANILPAPLVIVSTFVGYIADGLPGALLMTIGVFLPAFLFTLLGHNVIERLVDRTGLHNFLDGVAAGVLGLIVVTTIKISFYVIGDVWQCIFALIALVVLFATRAKYIIPLLIICSGIIGSLVYSINV